MKTYAQKPCHGCGKRQVIFEGENTQQLFQAWLINLLRNHSTLLAHNTRGYNSYFLLSYLIENSIVSKLVFNCTKIMYMHVERGRNIHVLDSLNFLPMQLAAFPKAFGLDKIKKGWFPHYFNTSCIEKLMSPYPSLEMYGVDSISPGHRDVFLQWYSLIEGDFNFREEMREYCVSDVDILHRTCIKFKNLILSITGNKISVTSRKTGEVTTRFKNGVDPFSFTTITSVCMVILRCLHLMNSN